MVRAHQINGADDVATALEDIHAGDSVSVGSDTIIARADIGKGHKLAIRPVSKGVALTKFGWPIGVATADIAPGDHVHSHNLATLLSGKATAPKRAPMRSPDIQRRAAFRVIAAPMGGSGRATRSGFSALSAASPTPHGGLPMRRPGALPGRSMASMPSPIRLAARNSAMILREHARSSRALPRIRMQAAS